MAFGWILSSSSEGSIPTLRLNLNGLRYSAMFDDILSHVDYVSIYINRSFVSVFYFISIMLFGYELRLTGWTISREFHAWKLQWNDMNIAYDSKSNILPSLPIGSDFHRSMAIFVTLVEKTISTLYWWVLVSGNSATHERDKLMRDPMYASKPTFTFLSHLEHKKHNPYQSSCFTTWEVCMAIECHWLLFYERHLSSR